MHAHMFAHLTKCICMHTHAHMHNFMNINNTGNCVKSKNSNYESIYIFLHSTLTSLIVMEISGK